jgi:hypothetical protein
MISRPSGGTGRFEIYYFCFMERELGDLSTTFNLAVKLIGNDLL